MDGFVIRLYHNFENVSRETEGFFMKVNDIYKAKVTGFTSEGLGVCRVEGCAVFVANAVPEEASSPPGQKRKRNYVV